MRKIQVRSGGKIKRHMGYLGREHAAPTIDARAYAKWLSASEAYAWFCSRPSKTVAKHGMAIQFGCYG
jgi:hypothetical protein